MASLSPMIITALLLAIILALSVWLFMVERRLRKLLNGKKAQSLEGVIGTLGEDIRALEKFRDETSAYLKTAEARLRRSIQGVETIRFNAFKGTGEGGNQSFAIALLSEEGDGTVVSSLYSRDRMSVFAKPVKNFSSEFEMTAEERDALTRARRS
jgi:hypothetical protein